MDIWKRLKGNLHLSERYKGIAAGTVCLVLAGILFWSALNDGAVNAAGGISFDPDNSDEVKFWNIGEGGTDGQITNLDGFYVGQKLTVDKAELWTDGETVEVQTGQPDTEVQAPYLEDAVFTVSGIKSELEIAWGEPYIDEVKAGYYEGNKGCIQRDSRTYYRIIEDGSTKFDAEEFEDGVRSEKNKEESVKNGSEVFAPTMLMSCGSNKNGRAFNDAIEAYMEANGYKEYMDGTKIPLVSGSGTSKIRIEMLTYSAVNLYFTVKNNTVNLFKEYDAVVYTASSYSFNGTSERMGAPSVELESQSSISDEISQDDSIIKLYNNSGSRYDEDFGKGIRQYYLSDDAGAFIQENDWMTWDGTAVPVNGSRYLYTRVIHDEALGLSEYKYMGSAAECYELRYMEPEAPPDIAGKLITGTGSDEDKLELSAGGSGTVPVFYSTEERLEFEKVPYEERMELDLDRKSSGTAAAGLVLDGVTYARVNNLWYRCGDSTKLYEEPVTTDYGTGCYFTVWAAALSDGADVTVSPAKISGLKLEAPSPILLSGLDMSAVSIAEDDALSGIERKTPEGLKDADQTAYETAYASGTMQYYLSDTRASGIQEADWKDFGTDCVWLEGKRYLYTRIKYSGKSFETLTMAGSRAEEYVINYISEEQNAGISASMKADTSITSAYTDTLTLSANDTKGLIFYTTDGKEPSFERVEDRKLYDILTGASGSCTEHDGTIYVRINGLWYSCSSSTRYYSGPVGITTADTTVKAVVLSDGKKRKAEAASFTFRKLDAPSVILESGTSIADAVPYDDVITALTNPYDQDEAVYTGYENGRLQYYLSTRRMNTIPDSSWLTWDGISDIPLNRRKYLYVRILPSAEGYVGSAAGEYELQYITETPQEVEAKAYAGGVEISGGVDYGDLIELIELESSDKGALIFYTTDGSNPSFMKVPYSEREELDRIYGGSTARSITVDGVRYVKVNNLWYECGASTRFYEKEIPVDESIYVDNYLSVNALAVVDGYTIGTPNRYSYSLTLREQVEAPASAPESGSAVQMGDYINLLCATSGSRIFYTLDGSAPVVDLGLSGLVLGGNTYEYTGAPIVISDDFAEYGSTVTIMAQACRFEEYNGVLSRTMKDSTLARLTFNVGEQAVVSSVTSVPATSSDNRTEVEAGSNIHLYTSTEGAVIFYTLDGTEPVFDETTLETKNSGTYKYNSSQGIKVPEMSDSSLVTITAVAYKTGLAASDISRLIFQYPSAVSAPYASPMDGSVTEGTQVSLKSATADAVIYYEVAYGDDTPEDPTEGSNVFDSSNPFTITKRTTIKAYAVKSGMKSSIVTFTYTVSEKLSTPKPSIASGAVVAAGTVIGLEADSEATIYYTTDGSDPKKADNAKVLVGDSVILSGSAGTVVTIRTYAAKNGYSDSEIGYYSYSISAYDGGIFADKETGSIVKNGEIVQLNTDVSDADIYYTTDGSTPDTGSTQGNMVTVSGAPGENVIIKAIAIASGTDKAISAATFTYTIMDKLAAPSASVPDGAVFTEESTVELMAETGKIYYTTNGDDPSTASSLYKRAVTIDKEMTIKAIAVDNDHEQSDISTFSYGFASQVAAPQSNFASGELEVGTSVSFSSETEDALIYYRTDGTDPDPDDKNNVELYTGPVTVEKATTFKLIAVKEHMQNSKVVTVGYTVREPELPQETAEEEEQTSGSLNGRLQSRHSFSNEESGPGFSAVVLRNAAYQAVVSADEGVLPDNVQLKVEPAQVSDASKNMVKQILSENYGIVASYNVTLLVNGEEVQPDGEIEIGLPIPADYENSIVQLVQMQEDGSVKIYSVRRAGGIAYAKVDHLSIYSIAAPVEYAEEAGGLPWLLIIYCVVAALAGLGILLLYRSRKERKEDEDWYV